MAFDVKGTFAWALLDLCEHKELSKITVKDLEEKTGFSRPTFYRHFRDKDDLVQYVYDTKVLYGLQDGEKANEEQADSTGFDVSGIYSGLVAEFRQMRKYRRFMKMALLLDSINSLWFHMIYEGRRMEVEWHKIMCGKSFTNEMEEATDYHAAASVYMIIEWVITDMPISEEELADKIIRNRVMSLPDVLGIEDEENIYIKMRKSMAKD